MSITSSSPTHRITSDILNKFYSNVKNLRSYLNDCLESSEINSQVNLVNEADAQSYQELLNLSFVGVRELTHKKFQFYPPMLEMRELLDRAQERLFKSKHPQNIITSGYRRASHLSDYGKKGMTRIGITNYFINTVVTAFQAPEWTALLTRIGEAPMLHLLTETSIFLSLPNGCLCQLAGEPIIYSMPKLQDATKPSSNTLLHRNQAAAGKRHRQNAPSDTEERPGKRRRLDIKAKKAPSKQSSPVDITFTRIRLFHSKPNFIPETNQILVGLPLKHVLTKLIPSYQRKGKLIHDPRQLSLNAQHLSKYVFARQYRLNTPFSTTAKTYSVGLGDYTDRESEIKSAGALKTPKRLKDILPLLEKMLRRHGRCAYLPIRDKTCPSKIKTSGSKDLDNTIILELVSEASIRLRSQISLGSGDISVDSTGIPIPAMGLTQARKHVKYKPRFIEFSCSYVEVYRYIALVTKTVIPKSFWGSESNLRLVLRYVKEFITYRRYETLNLHYILQNFSTSACDWLVPPGPGARLQARVSVSDSLKRRELLEDFLFWYFDSFVLPLLKTAFYVTESSAFRNQVLYFRHDDWATLCAPLTDRLTTVTFEKLSTTEAAEILRQRKLGFSFVRLLPKETGVRPIVNLRRRKTVARGSFSSEQSINQILQAAFSILTYERANQPDLLGASIFGPDDIHSKLKKLKASLPRDPSGLLPKLYFVKVDVQACFDTIEQTKLLQILRQLISEDTFMIQKYGQVNMALGRIKKSYVKKAVPEDDHPHFLRYAVDLANVLRNTIFVDQVVYPLSKKQEVLALLEEHITENIVKIGQSYYRQTVGIPQGSVLSSILCSFFYGDLEKTFSRFTKDPQSTMLRLIDDYLFVTTSRKLAVDFLETMKKGHPEYGCFISQEKTLTNFDHGDQVHNVVDSSQRTFPWCGYCINMQDLSITADYTRYHASGIRCTLTIDRGRRPGAAFSYKLQQLARAKSHAIFSDGELNSERVVYLNIYQNLLLTAMKMHEYIRDWGVSGRKNTAFLRRVIEQTIECNYSTVRAQARRKGRKCESALEIHKEAVVWLGNHAFHHILSRKPSNYKALLFWLGFEMRRAKYRQHHRRFKSLVKEAQAGFKEIA